MFIHRREGLSFTSTKEKKKRGKLVARKGGRGSIFSPEDGNAAGMRGSERARQIPLRGEIGGEDTLATQPPSPRDAGGAAVALDERGGGWG